MIWIEVWCHILSDTIKHEHRRIYHQNVRGWIFNVASWALILLVAGIMAVKHWEDTAWACQSLEGQLMWAQIAYVAGTAGSNLFYAGILEFAAFEVGECKWTGHIRQAQWAVGPF